MTVAGDPTFNQANNMPYDFRGLVRGVDLFDMAVAASAAVCCVHRWSCDVTSPVRVVGAVVVVA